MISTSHSTDHYLYYAAGEHIQRVVLTYHAEPMNAICCSRDYIILAALTPSAIHTHSWSGEHLRTLSQQELNIAEDVWIVSVNCDMALSTVFLALGVDTTPNDRYAKLATTSLQAYRVSGKWYDLPNICMSQENW